MTSYRSDRGQAAVLTVFFIVVLLGVSAAVLDVGSWYRADRELQKTMDAAALAAAQELPDDPGGASSLADEYAGKNGGGLDSTQISTTKIANDTVKVVGSRPAPGFFSKIIGIDSVTVNATATARSGVLASARWAGPIAVDERHPFLQGKRWGEDTELELDTLGPGAYRLINIDGSYGGTNPGTLGDWIRDGYEGYMPLGWYYSDPGAKYNTNPNFKSALEDVIVTGQEVLFPVYRSFKEQGAGFEYEIVGWVGFVVTDFEIQGSKNNIIRGYFTQVIWDGIFSEEASPDDFGARAVSLIE
ncbi:MAG TPA: flp pilus-assembly TadE/G-like family protein [Gaiellaceae bacterium]|nr:flp pilus-assembly TadE/G-like family protein [Gaiellaceae bacterium]